MVFNCRVNLGESRKLEEIEGQLVVGGFLLEVMMVSGDQSGRFVRVFRKQNGYFLYFVILLGITVICKCLFSIIIVIRRKYVLGRLVVVCKWRLFGLKGGFGISQKDVSWSGLWFGGWVVFQFFGCLELIDEQMFFFEFMFGQGFLDRGWKCCRYLIQFFFL